MLLPGSSIALICFYATLTHAVCTSSASMLIKECEHACPVRFSTFVTGCMPCMVHQFGTQKQARNSALSQTAFCNCWIVILTAQCRPVPSMSRGFPLQHRLSASQSAAFLPAHSLVSDRSVVQQLSAVSADLQQAASSGALISEASVAQYFSVIDFDLIYSKT